MEVIMAKGLMDRETKSRNGGTHQGKFPLESPTPSASTYGPHSCKGPPTAQSFAALRFALALAPVLRYPLLAWTAPREISTAGVLLENGNRLC